MSKREKRRQEAETIEAAQTYSDEHKQSQLVNTDTVADADADAEYAELLKQVFNFKPEPAPYLRPLPKAQRGKRYTLVLDLDETLIHYEEVAIL